jgi:hypothetical protein
MSVDIAGNKKGVDVKPLVNFTEQLKAFGDNGNKE